jgi:hypothetical protein
MTQNRYPKILTSLIIFCFAISFTVSAQQGVSINAAGTAPDNSAMLDISSSTKGLLTPRMTEAQKNAIASPATGLLIYQTDNTTGFWYYNGAIWIQPIGPMGPTGPAGPTGANGATGPAGDQYSTTSTDCLNITLGGPVCFTVGTGLAYSVGQSIIIAYDISNNMIASVLSYNNATGAICVTVTSITGAGNYCSWSVNMNGAPGPAGPAGPTGLAGANGATGPAGPVGCGTANYVVKSTGGSAVCSQIYDDGTNVGVGLVPSQKLDIAGNLQFSGAIMPSGNAGTTNKVLTSQGAGISPTWTNPTGMVYNNTYAVASSAALSPLPDYPTFGVIPNLTRTISLTGNALVWIYTDGGAQTTSLTNNQATIVDVVIMNNGTWLPQGGYKRLQVDNPSNYTGGFAYWSMGSYVFLAAGTYTFTVQASHNGGAADAVVAGDNSTVLEGVMVIQVFYQ